MQAQFINVRVQSSQLGAMGLLHFFLVGILHGLNGYIKRKSHTFQNFLLGQDSLRKKQNKNLNKTRGLRVCMFSNVIYVDSKSPEDNDADDFIKSQELQKEHNATAAGVPLV